MNFRVTSLLIFSLLFLLPTAVLAQQGVTAFNYQGQIFDADGQPVTGECGFIFQIYDAVDSPAALALLQVDDLAVTDGLFSISIDFGTDVFDASPRWLETAVRCGSDPDFDNLGRQQILSVPYATYAYGVDWANVRNRPAYTAGAGLALSGTEFSIPTPFQLPQGCADNEIPKWAGSSWACASDSNSDTLATLSCEVGQVAEWRGSNWVCSNLSGEGTTYTAGTGLALTGTEFSIPPPYQLPQGCAAGESASWTGSSWACASPVDAYTRAEVDTALAGKIDATKVYTTAEIDSQLAVVQADLAGKIDETDVYTTAQVDSLLANRADISHTHTAVATATVALAVDWGDIINTPTGFADGTDDSDDLVSWPEISGIVGTGATDVAGGNHTHTYADPTNGAGVYLAYKPNNIACLSNQVLKWDAAGSRWVCGNASGGDITGVTAGSGLNGGGASGSVTLGADFAGTGSALTVARSDHSHNTDYYTQSQVDTVLALKIDGTEVYTTGQVDAALGQKLDASAHTWSGLSGVPADLADGTDDTDDTVSWSEISGIVGTGATDVAGGNHNHDSDYYTQRQVDTVLSGKIDGTEVYTIGEIDSQIATVQADLALKIDASEVYTTGQVDAALAQKLDAADHTWSGLSGVPSGLADGTDNTDDTVSWSEINGIVGTDATNVAGGNHNHDSDYYTQRQVDTVLSGKIDGTEVYTTGEIDSQIATVQADLATKIDASEVYTTGQVDTALAQKLDAADHTWSGLSGVPAGLADGTDNTDDTVSWLEISGIVGTGATDVAGGSHAHDTDYYTQRQVDTALATKIDGTKVYTTGEIDSQIGTVHADLATKIDATEVYTTGQVDAVLAQKLDASDHTWSGLSGVPVGFSDDTDNTDDTVSWSEISGIVGTGAADVAGGNHNHDAAYVDEGEIDSITSAMITDGSVTSADLQDGAVLAEILDDDGSGSTLDADRLDGQDSSAFAASSHSHNTDYYTQSQVDTVLALKIDASEVYTTGQVDAALALKIDASEVYTTGQVDSALAQKLDANAHTWSGLSGVPAGLADGTDDTDDTVSWSEISGIVGTGATDVAGGSHSHNTDYYTQSQVDTALADKIDATEVYTTGEIDSQMATVQTDLATKMDASEVYTTGQMDTALAQKLDASAHTWSGMSGVPAGFSDDTDDTNDTVSWAEISGIVGTGATDVAGGSHSHNTDYYTQSQVDTALALKIDATEVYTTAEIDSQMAIVQADLATKIDASEVYTTGQVDTALAGKLDASDHTWSGMSGVPAGFSDDTDDTNDTVSWAEISGIVGTGATDVAGGSHNHASTYVDEGQANSVTSGMITNGSVTSADLQDGAALAEILDDDGSGSGLDADKLDGQSSSAFATSGHSHSYADPTNGVGVYLKYKPNNAACTSNQVLKWDATNARWICGTDSVNTGDITGVTAGTGLTGGGTSGSVTLNTNFSGTGSASTVSRSDHNHASTYVDEGQANSVTSGMITNGSVTSTDLQDGAALAEILDDDGAGSNLDADKLDALSSASFFILNQNETVSGRPAFNGGTSGSTAPFSVDSNTVVTNLNADKLDGQDGAYYWSAGGNAAASGNFIGTTNSEALVFKTNNLVGLRIDQGVGAATDAPAVIGGYLGNTAIWQGATIAGGGYAGNVNSAGYYGSVGGGYDNVASGDESTIGGGWRNQASAGSTTIGGGYSNTASGTASVIGGGNLNTVSAQKSFVGGGESNTVSGDYSAVVGGDSNQTLDQYSTVVGGSQNKANYNAFIGGGWDNVAFGSQAVVVGGHQNVVSGTLGTVVGGTVNVVDDTADYAFIGGGMQNTASGVSTFIGGGEVNVASGNYSTIGGGVTNSASAYGAVVAGGDVNRAIGNVSAVCGGDSNKADGDASFIGGGRDNQASGSYAVIGGGNGNTASSGSSTVGGGTGNVASSSSATVSGGQSNTASGGSSAIGGGQSNTASANWGTVSGGYNNTVSSSYSTIGGGFGNQISSTGLGAAIPGGLNNAAPGATSFAAGRQAKANHDGTFVWGDSTSADIASNAGNSVTFRASGGYRLFTNSAASTGASLAAGSGSWASMSDRNQKENLQPVDTQAVLEQVGQLPLSTWNYISQEDDIRHIGPMAQDFHAAFGVGENETTITAIDGDGVSLAAIQALYERVKALEAENEALKAENEAEKARLDVLEARLDVLEAAVQ